MIIYIILSIYTVGFIATSIGLGMAVGEDDTGGALLCGVTWPFFWMFVIMEFSTRLCLRIGSNIRKRFAKK